MNEGAIREYLEQLERELRVKHAPRRRLLTEAADHLESSAADLVAGGVSRDEAERRAVERFGAAALVARRFAHAAASTTVRVAFLVVTTAFVAYALAAILFVLAAPPWLHDFPQGAPSGLALQVAVVALTVTALRTYRFRRTLLIEEPRLRFVANGVAVAALVLAIAATLELVLAWTRPAAAPWSDVEPFIATYAVASLAVLTAALIAVACAARARALDALPRRRHDAVPSATAALVEDVAVTVPPLTRIAAYALSRGGRACVVVAFAGFCAMSVASLVGADFWNHASVVAGAAATGLFEAAAVVAGYLTLGRVLGLRAERKPFASR